MVSNNGGEGSSGGVQGLDRWGLKIKSPTVDAPPNGDFFHSLLPDFFFTGGSGY